jgi:hypothetical protein
VTIIDDRTTNQNYTLPNGANLLGDDVSRVRAAFGAIDTDMAATLASLAGKAAATHNHIISDVAGLQAALDTKLTSASLSTYVTATSLTSILGSYVTATALSTGLATKASTVHVHVATDISGLSTVATSGSYSDLASKPTLGTVAQRDSATAADIQANTANKAIETDEAWASITSVSLTDGATIAVNLNTLINGKVTLGGNRTLSFSNGKPGQSGRIEIKQDGTGSRTLSYTAGQTVNPSGTAPVLSTAANARDILYYDVLDDGKISLSISKAVS